MASSSDESSWAVAQTSTPRTSSALTKTPVLPPIAPAAHGFTSETPMPARDASAAAAPPPPPSPTGAMPNEINDANVELFLSKKLALLKHVMGVPDLKDNAEKYLPVCRGISHGTGKAINPSLKNRLKTHKIYADNGYFEFLMRYWNSLTVEDSKVWDTKLASPKRQAQMTIFRTMVIPIINGTDTADPDYCKKVNDTLGPFFLRLLDSPVFYDITGSSLQTGALGSMLGSLYNLVHLFSDGEKSVRDGGGVRIASRYVGHPEVSLKTLAVLTLSYIVSEDEQHRLLGMDEQIKYLVDVLQSCLKSTGVTHYSRVHGFQAEEIVDGLNHIAQVDSNKAAIVRCGALPLYTQLLNKACDAAEQAAAAKGLWILAFNEENRDRIQREPGCTDGLRRLLNSEYADVRQSAEGALWAIEVEVQRVRRSTAVAEQTAATTAAPAVPSGQRTGHIMISYNWGVKPEVIKMKDRLKACGYKVWIDVEQMSGSTLDAMANAIEQASLVIIVFTENYKKSPSCRSEAEYCYKTQKPFIPVRLQQKYVADGWLGIILGTRLFFDLTKPGEWETTFEMLRAEINRMVGLQENTSSAMAAPKHSDKTDGAGLGSAERSPDTLTSSIGGDANRQFAASAWSEDDVRNWLRECGLQNRCDSFAGFTGLQIVELRHALTSAPVYFYGALQQSLNMSLKDAMTFTKVLRDLK